MQEVIRHPGKALGRFSTKNHYDVVAGGISLLSIPIQKYAETHTSPDEISSRLLYNLIYNTGDIAEAVLFGAVANIGFRYATPHMNPYERVLLASGASFIGIVALETVQFGYPLSLVTGTADKGDIPSGILGVGGYMALGLITEAGLHAHRTIKKRKANRISTG